MSSMSKVCIAVLSIGLMAPVWAINKCTGADGKVVFQDAPCELSAKTEAITVRPGSGRADPIAVTQAGTRSGISAAIAVGKPAVGMTEAELQQAMGTPTTVNADNYNGRHKSQIIYNRPTETYYVYTEDGVVTSIQNRPALAATTSAPAINCPTPHEIRNMETSASSTTISESSRQALLAQVRDMKNCGRK